MKRRMIALLLLLPLLLAGCTSADAGQATELAPTSEVLPESVVQPRADADANAGMTVFGVELLRQVRQGGANTLLSPFSAAIALSMTANGADGDTLAAFEAVLGADTEALNANAAQLMADYAALGGSTKASVANSLWVDEATTLYEDFLVHAAGYDAGLFSADLDTDGARRAVNRWVSEHTDGMIPEILAQNLEPHIALLLVNAVYLENAFQSPFSANATGPWDFTADDGTVTSTDFMRQTADLPYCSADGVTGAVLPYDDGRLAFVVLLPEAGLDSWLAELDGEALTALIASAQETRLFLSMPKFTAAWSEQLNEALSAMGLAVAFDQNRADLSRMGERNGNFFYLDFVIQSARLEVNEEGTRAAAATIVAPGDSAAPLPPAELILDRPFLYAIWDLEAQIPLFLGTYETP